MSYYTLKPEICKKSQTFKRSYKHPCEDSLIEYKDRFENKVFEERMILDNQEILGFSFTPQINPKSWEIGDKSVRVEKDGLGSIHDVLYLNSLYRKNE